MAGFITCTEFHTPISYVTSGDGAANSSFPHSYAADIVHAHRPWKSAANLALNTTFYGVRFSGPVECPGVGIDNVNVSAVVLEGASNSAYTDDLLSVGVPIGSNQVERSLFGTSNGSLGRLKAFVDLDGTDFEGEAREYWRLLCAVTQPVTGVDGAMFVGSVAWCSQLTRWESGTSRYRERALEATRLNDDFAGGGAEPVIVGNANAAVGLAGAPAAIEMRTPLLRVVRQGLGRPFLFYRNAGDTADFYICHRANDLDVDTTAPTLIEFSEFLMRSAV